jgi:predicted nucleic acid-binding protein
VPALIVADTGPLRYLVLIGHVAVLPRLFGTIIVPVTVAGELRHPHTPEVVRAWATTPPQWLSMHDDPPQLAALRGLDPGERAAIALAGTLGAGLLMDDRAGVAAARERGFRVTGTIGVLLDAAAEELLDLQVALGALRATNFRYPTALFDTLLREHQERRTEGPPDGT